MTRDGHLDETGRAAWAQAAEAADRSGVTVRQLRSIDEMRAGVELFDAIWRPSDGTSIMKIEFLQALASANSYVAGAFDGDVLLGACAGFWGPPSRHTLHSHIAGVAEVAQGRHLGFALKVHQRAWALEQGVRTITWTFDPLVRRNAYFNIGKLGGRVRTYYVDHYGSMLDDLNGDDESDRLKLEWDLTSPRTARCCAGQPLDAVPRTAPPVLSQDRSGRPVVTSSDASEVLVTVPVGIETLRHRDPDLAGSWRLAVRDVLGGLLSEGGQVDAFDRVAGGYIVTRG